MVSGFQSLHALLQGRIGAQKKLVFFCQSINVLCTVVILERCQSLVEDVIGVEKTLYFVLMDVVLTHHALAQCVIGVGKTHVFLRQSLDVLLEKRILFF